MSGKQASGTVLAVPEAMELDPHFEPIATLTDLAKQSVRVELRRLVGSHLFSTSPRCQSLLSYVVESVLEGHTESLKERSIGVSVFSRALTYDTNSDPVVRMVAGEVRKRLAQYYYGPGKDSSIRIVMRTGSYVPTFFTQNADAQGQASRPLQTAGTSHSDSVPPARFSLWRLARRILSSRSGLWYFGAGAVVALLAAFSFVQYRSAQHDAYYRFWEPVVQSPDPVLICVGHRMANWFQFNAEGALGVSATPAKLNPDDQRKWPGMALYDGFALSKIAAVLQQNKKPYSIRGQAFTTYDDQQKGPVILLGAFNNDWTVQLLKNTRFRFEKDELNHLQWIADQQNPGTRIGTVQIDNNYNTTEDHAIVARFLDPQTRQLTIVAAGINASATRAAADFITSPVYLDEFFRQAPKDWQRKNMELVIVASDVNGDSGAPKVMASYFW